MPTHQCLRPQRCPSLHLHQSSLHRLKLASSAGSKACLVAHLRLLLSLHERLSRLPTTNRETRNPEMPPAEMVVADVTADASHALRVEVMAEVKDVATGVAGVDDLIAVPSGVASERLALTVLRRTRRASVWMPTAEPCQSPPIRHRMAHQALIFPKMAMDRKPPASAALAVAANGVAVAATVSVATAQYLSAVQTAR